MDSVLAGAFIDDASDDYYSGPRILGVRPRKFCLWHQYLLTAADSPLMSNGRSSLRDLRVAAGICRLKPFDSRVRKPWLMPAWIYVRFILGSVVGGKKRRNDPARLQRALKKQCDAFSEYAKVYLQEPEYCIIPPSRRPGQEPPEGRGRFHDIVEHVGELITWGGLSAEKRIWGMPLGVANVYRIIARRAAGNDVEITSEEEKKFQEQVPPQFRRKKT